MKFIITLLVLTTVVLIFPPKAQAIIILPAVILIPIAQMVAVIVAALGIPVASIGIFIKTVSKNNKLAIKISLITMIAIIILSLLILKIKYPNNPWF